MRGTEERGEVKNFHVYISNILYITVEMVFPIPRKEKEELQQRTDGNATMSRSSRRHSKGRLQTLATLPIPINVRKCIHGY